MFKSLGLVRFKKNILEKSLMLAKVTFIKVKTVKTVANIVKYNYIFKIRFILIYFKM